MPAYKMHISTGFWNHGAVHRRLARQTDPRDPYMYVTHKDDRFTNLLPLQTTAVTNDNTQVFAGMYYTRFISSMYGHGLTQTGHDPQRV